MLLNFFVIRSILHFEVVGIDQDNHVGVVLFGEFEREVFPSSFKNFIILVYFETQDLLVPLAHLIELKLKLEGESSWIRGLIY